MKKFILNLILVVSAVLLLASCGVSQNMTSNTNLQQTNVVLSQNNYHVVKSVEAEVSSTYVFGIGGLSKRALHSNAVAELTKKANLTGSQALINVTVKSSGKLIFFFGKTTFSAQGTVIEFDK